MDAGKNIYQRLAEAMAEVPYIQKDPKKPGMQYSYVSHDAVTAKVRPALLKQGIVYYPSRVQMSQDGNRTVAHITMLFVNIDNPDDFIATESFGYGVDNQDKGPGKAMSYAVKYALLKTLGLETGDDPDHTQDASANYEAPDLGSLKGEGPSRFASRKPYEIFLEQLAGKTDLDDLNQWWVETRPTRDKQMNSETRHFAFMEMMKQGLAVAPGIDDLRLFWVSHKSELEELKRRNASEYHGLEDHKEKAKGRFLLNA